MGPFYVIEITYGVRGNFEGDWDLSRMFFGAPYNYWGSVLVCFGWVGLVMLACRAGSLASITRPLAAVGQMAFSNYILQTVICTTLFYGHGFGLFGQVSRVGQFGTVVAIWAIQIPVSVLWLRRFRYGPLEWLWRTLSYGQRQAMRRV